MGIREEALRYSERLAIPTYELEFNEYYDPDIGGGKDIVQVYFRDDTPIRDKYAFEVPVDDNSDTLSGEERTMLEDLMKLMEEAYLDRGARAAWYDERHFFWQFIHQTTEEMDEFSAHLEVVCTICGSKLRTPDIPVDKFDKSRYILLMWLLGVGKGRCDCSGFEPADRGHSSTNAQPDNLMVPEGARIPRACQN